MPNPMTDCRYPRSHLLRQATILLAWACWGLAYWKSLWWLVPLSFLPYFLANRFGHLLDEQQD